MVFNNTATTEIYTNRHTLSLHDALPISDRTASFYRAWLDHYITKADVDAMGRWGFNSIRLPMHYNLLLDETAPAGMDRWKEDGFARIDALIDWARENQIYVILDLQDRKSIRLNSSH